MIRTALIVLLSLAAATGCIREVAEEPALKASPQEAALANLQLGAAYLQKGNFEAALTKLQKAVDQDPTLAPAHSTLALALERMGMVDEADFHYREAIRLSKEDASIHNAYGVYLCRKGEFREAESYFLKAARNPRYRTPEAAYTNAGTCAVREKDFTRGEEHLRKALSVNARYADALWQMAQLSFELDRALQARAFLQRLSESTPLPSNALWLARQVELSLGDRQAADRYARTLKTDFPDSRETALLLEQERNGG